ncbi:hypothetical protein ASE86_06670 [Sphingomonas sp. Leaf33]|nr:hypothetical protein ASE86_06670 [Sphingomonas sp. Leaf33]
MGQLIAVALVIVAIALWPPQRGAMLMIPLTGHAADAINVALTGRAGVLAAGPFPGSMIVMGDRTALGRAALHRGILLLAAPGALCNAGGADGVPS